MSKIETLRRALLAILREHEENDALPTSARFLFYELVTRGIVTKEATGARRADQDMIDALTDLRERGEIPWRWIADETRQLHDRSGAVSIKEGLLHLIPYIAIDPWNGSVPLVLTESRSLAGVLGDVAGEYAVRIASTNGQVAGFLHNAIAPSLSAGGRVLYLGDWDFAGGHIEANARSVLRVTGPLEWERLALTSAQVAEYDLPVLQKCDRRHKGGETHPSVETEALSQTVIVELLRARLNALLPESLESVHEQLERDRIHAMLERL